MQATLIDKNNYFLPSDLSSRIRCTIDVICTNDKQIQFLMDYLQSFDLSGEIEKTIEKETKEKIEANKKMRLN